MHDSGPSRWARLFVTAVSVAAVVYAFAAPFSHSN
jgi:hypothetical protein